MAFQSVALNVQSVVAATPANIVQYQGRLLNANGVPVSAASASVIFEFYTAVSGGTCLWSNTSSTCVSATARTVTLTDGLFSEPLGNTTLGDPYAAIPESVFGDNANVFLQVTINGETLTPRKRVMSAAYAINSSLVDGLDTTLVGSTQSALPAFNANGALVVTGNPTGSGVSQGSMYINPAALDVNASDTIFGVAVGGTDLFRIDGEGDVIIGGVALNASSGTAGATLVGVDTSAFTQSIGTEVQGVLADFDTAIDALAVSSSKWTDDGAFTYLTDLDDGLLIGGDEISSATFYFDEAEAQLLLGIDTVQSGSIVLYDGFSGSVTLSAASGGLDINAPSVNLTSDLNIDTGDLVINSVGLSQSSGTAGATLVGVDSALFTQSSEVDVQGVLTDFDTAIDALAAGSSKWTDAGAFTYLTGTSDDLVVGSTLTTTAPLYFDTSTETLYVGSDSEPGTILLRGGSSSINIGSDASGNLDLTANQIIIDTSGNITTDGDLSIAGGDFISTNDLDFMNDALSAPNINFGGVTVDQANTIFMATDDTTGDILFFGNSNTDTIVDITGGDDWYIDQFGEAEFVTVIAELGNFLDVALNGGDITSNGTTLNFLDGGGSTTNIDIGGVTSDIANVINIATNVTSGDVINIGNDNVGTAVAINGGDDWQIRADGDAEFHTVDLQSLRSPEISLMAVGVLPGETGFAAFVELAGSNYVGFKAPDAIASDTVWTLPATDGSSGQFLSTDGLGILSWEDGGTIAADSLDFTEFADSMTTDGSLTISAANDVVWNLTSVGNFEIQDLGSQVFAIDATSGAAIFSDTLDINQNTVDGEFTDIDVAHTTDTSINPFDLRVTNTAAASTAANYLMFLANNDDGGATGTFDAFIRLANNDSNESVGIGLDLVGTGGYGTGISLSDTSIGTGIDLGANDIIGTAAAIDFTYFDVDNAGVITSSAYLDIPTVYADALASNGDLNISSNSLNALTIEAGTDMIIAPAGTDTLTLGHSNASFLLDLTGGDDWSIDATGAATFTALDCPNCLDFDSLEFQLNLDESTDIALGTNQFNVELDDTGNFYIAMTGTGDHIIQTGGTPFAVFNDGATIDFSSNSGGVDFIDIDGGTITTAAALDVTVNGLLSGVGLQVSSNSTGLTSGDLSRLSHTATYIAPATVSGNGISVTRALTNNSGGALSVTGDLLQLISNNANTSGTLTDSAHVISVAQGNAGATGAVIQVENDGTGSGVNIQQDESTSTTVTNEVGGALHVGNTGNDDYGLTVYTNGGTSTSPLAYIFSDNTSFDNHVFHVRNDSTQTNSSAMRIEQNTVSDSSTTTNFALLVDTNETASNDELVVFRSDADGTPDIEFRFEADGDAFADGSFTGGGADLAEWMISSDGSLGGNDVVCRDESTLNGVKECAPGETSIIGAISTNPGFIGNYQESFDYGIPANYRLVGLIGQIDVSASAADGAIAVGDLVTTSSSVAGAVGKAGGPSRVLGYALEPLAAGSGVIKVMVQPTWSAEGTITSDGSAIVMRETFALASLATANSSANYGSELLSFRGSAWNGSSAQSVAMGLETMVDSVSAYRLAVTNTAGTEVASINQNGDLSLAGRFYPSDSGAMQNSAYIYYDSSGLGYMRTNAAGWSTGSYDFAEMFPSPDALVPGEVVVFGTGREQMTRSTGKKYDDRIAGIVSTRPGFLAGEWRDGEYPVALAGRVPTFVSSENGAIKVGDPLTTSSKPGYAMKATQPGPIVGYAMEDHASGDGSIIVFVRASYYDGASTNVAPAADTAISGLASSTVATLDITGTLNMNGGGIFSVGSIEGVGGAWSISGNGDIETEGRLVQLVRSYQNEDVETYAATSREMTIQLSGTATLQNGTALVNLESIDPKFNDIISNEVPYRVFVTPNGATGQISVTNRDQASFVIRDSSGSDGILVDWLVVGTHKDYAQTVAPVVTEPEPPEVPEDNLPEDEEVLNESEDQSDEEVVVEDEEVVDETPVDESSDSEEVVVDEIETEDEPVVEDVAPVVEEENIEGGEELIDEVLEVTP